MKRLYIFQLLACALVLLALISAEGAAYLLAAFPGSSVLWVINQGLFRPIQQATYLHSPMHLYFGPYVGLIAAALLGAAAYFALTGKRFLIAGVSHLCLLFMVGIGRVWMETRPSLPATASLDPAIGLVLRAVSQPEALITGPLVIAAAAAAMAGHLTFILSDDIHRESKSLLQFGNRGAD